MSIRRHKIVTSKIIQTKAQFQNMARKFIIKVLLGGSLN